MASALRDGVRWLLCLLVFTVPVEDLFLIDGIGTVSRILGLVAAPLAGAAILVDGRWRPFRDTHLIAIVFAMWVLLSLTWTVDPTAGVERTFTVLQLLVLFVLFWQFIDDRVWHRRMLGSYVLGGALTCGLMLQLRAQGTGNYDVGRFAPGNANPNDVGYVLALSIPMAWHLAGLVRHRGLSLLVRSYVPLAVLTVLLTGSRGALIVLVVACSFIVLSTKRSPANLAALAGTAVVLVIAISFVVPTATIARLASTADEIESGTLNARRDIWAAAANLIEDHPVVGSGVGSSEAGIVRQTGLDLGTHNSFLSVFVQTGAVGLALFVLMLASVAVRAAGRSGTSRLFSLVLFATLLVVLYPAHWEFRKGTWVVLAILLGEEIVEAVPRRVPVRTAAVPIAGRT